MFFILFGVIYILIGLVTLMMLGTLLGYLTEHSKYQKLFVKGMVPKELPNGYYKGEAIFLCGLKTPWLGKAFIPADMTGFNLFTQLGVRVLKVVAPMYRRFSRNENGMISAFVFKVRIDKSYREQKDVIVLDYSAKENPFFIRIIVDEIVEIGSGEYLGKIYLKLFPGFVVSFGFFGLKKIHTV